MFIENQNQGLPYDVTVVGLGYVGLTLAVALCDVGLRVLGIEQNKNIVNSLKKGIPHFAEKGMQTSMKRVLQDNLLVVQNNFKTSDFSNYFIITVGTPLDKHGQPRNDFITRATSQVAKQLRPNDTVILRSTVAVGTTNRIVRKILERKNIKFNLSMCPERTLEGNAMQELRYLPQIIGADDVQSKKISEDLFRLLTKVTVCVSSCESAEVIKLADNTFRDVSFAFGNEIARICEVVGINATEIIRAGKLGYTRTNIAMPGLVGGPCLEKDPHILMQSMKSLGLDLDITKAARLVNERQPKEIVEKIHDLCVKNISTNNTIIVLAGIAFKGSPETDDMRGSMAFKLLHYLHEYFNEPHIRIYDPVIDTQKLVKQFPNYEICDSIEASVQESDIMIIGNNHPKLGSIHPKNIKKNMKKNSFIFDVWNHFSDSDMLKELNYYFALGSVNHNLNKGFLNE